MAKTAHEADDGQVNLDFDEEPQEVVLEDESGTEEKTEIPQVAVETVAEDDDEVSQQSKKVQKRINQLTKRAKEAEREREEAFRYAQAVHQESENLKSRMNNLDKNYIDEYGNRVMVEQQQAQNELKRAMELGDSDASVAAQTKISQLAVAADRHQQAKAQRERQQATVEAPAPAPQFAQPSPQQPPQAAPQEPDPKAEAWAENNAWFGDDYTRTFAAFGLHKKMVEEEGFDPKSNDYYDELDSRMREEFPHKFNEEESTTTAPRRNAQTVASVSRSSSSGRGRKVRLSPSQVTIAKRLGVPLEEYARYVKE